MRNKILKIDGGKLLLKRLLHTTTTTCCQQNQIDDTERYVPASRSVCQHDVDRLSEFVHRHSRLFVITGAGLSTESGIKDYRSEKVGLYATSAQRPIQYQEFLNDPYTRKRYWARNFAGWPLFSSFEPNPNHHVLREWERVGKLHWLVTQNVDGLHAKAGSKRVTELHGAARRVNCLQCGHQIDRHALQQTLTQLNADWSSSSRGKQAPDGDVMIDDRDVEIFTAADCPKCSGILKPDVVFFGDNVPAHVKNECFERLGETDGLLVIGSSLQVYSSFRFIPAAREKKIPIAILNIGPTRADKYTDMKIDLKAGDILPKIVL